MEALVPLVDTDDEDAAITANLQPRTGVDFHREIPRTLAGAPASRSMTVRPPDCTAAVRSRSAKYPPCAAS